MESNKQGITIHEGKFYVNVRGFSYWSIQQISDDDILKDFEGESLETQQEIGMLAIQTKNIEIERHLLSIDRLLRNQYDL